MKKNRARVIKPGDLPGGYEVFFDGCCEPTNPGGTAGYGVAVFDMRRPGHRAWEHSGMIPAAPDTSNNVAEYMAVKAGLAWLYEQHLNFETIRFFGDSRLVVCQMWGWPVLGESMWKIHPVDCEGSRCKHCHGARGRYVDVALEVREMLTSFARVSGFWIPREENSLADELSKAELRKAGVEFRIQPENADA